MLRGSAPSKRRSANGRWVLSDSSGQDAGHSRCVWVVVAVYTWGVEFKSAADVTIRLLVLGSRSINSAHNSRFPHVLISRRISINCYMVTKRSVRRFARGNPLCYTRSYPLP